jgi:hypothetical protein
MILKIKKYSILKMKTTSKVEMIKLLMAVVIVIFGCSLITAGFIVPPLGVISNSVLVAFGEILTFAGTVLGINYTYQYKLKQLEEKLPKDE